MLLGLRGPFYRPDGGQDGGGAAGGGAAGGGAPEQNAPRTFSEDYVRALRAESAGYRTKLKGVEDQIVAIRKALGISEGQEVTDWAKVVQEREDAHKKAVADAQEAGRKLMVRAEVTAQAAALGIVDADAAFALADLSKVQVAEDGKVSGVKETLEALLTAKPYLKKMATGAGIGAGTNPGEPNSTPNPWAKETFNLTEQARLLRENPALAESMRKAAKTKG